jgi:hypothetical protein
MSDAFNAAVANAQTTAIFVDRAVRLGRLRCEEGGRCYVDGNGPMSLGHALRMLGQDPDNVTLNSDPNSL